MNASLRALHTIGRARQLALLTLAVGLVWLLPAAPALAAETVIGFDNLTAGESVTNQYEAQGLKLGTAEALGVPGAIGAGNCGAPTAQLGTDVAAASPPDYAVLATCPASIHTEGTYGALLGAPRGTLSVEVRNLTSSTPNVPVTLTGYDSAGAEVASGHGEATGGSWTTITVSLNGAGKISYFAISTAVVTSQEVAIDNLSFEAATTTTTTTVTTTPPPGSTPPTASLALTTPNPTAGKPITLSGAGSTPGSGQIVSYGWNFGGGTKVETSTGTNPNAQVLLGPGAHTVALTVTNSNGQHTTSLLGFNLSNSHIHLPDGGEGECLPKLEIGDADMLAECIQKLGSGYVIGGPELEINGMVLVPTSGGPMKIKTVTDYGIGGSATELYGAHVSVELLNTPIGNVVLGERNLEAEPIVLDTYSVLSHTFPLYHGLKGPRARAADKPTKTLLMAIGVGKQCSASEKSNANCCPPKNGLTACAELPGNFPLTGQVDVYLSNTGQALFDVQVGLSLKSVNFEATGSLEIIANLEKGIELSSLEFTIPEASLAPIFKVTKAKFAYYFPEYYEASKRNSWQAKGIITFGEEIVELEAELAFKQGNFQSAAMKFKTAHGGVPIYPGIFLNEIGASVSVNPLSFGGSLGASIAELLELELDFKFREATSEELGFFGGKGALTFHDDEIASIAADVYSDGYVDAQVVFNLHFPFESKDPVIEVRGGVGFWDEPASGLWQANGNINLKLWIISAEVAGLVNNQYAAGCLHVGAEGIFGGGVQGRYRFSDGNISGGLFGNDNCTDQLKQYTETPLKEHKGGFVGGESARFFGGGNPVSAQLPLLDDVGGRVAATQSGDSFTLPAGTMGQELRVFSSTGTPVFTLIGPNGKSYATPAVAGQLVTVPGQFMSAIGPNPGEVLVLLRNPAGGEWKLQPAPGSPPISKLETAQETPPASVSVHVSHGHGHGAKWSLAYKVGGLAAGTKVRLVERGKDSAHVLGTVSAARGTIHFTPAEGLSRPRKLLAYLINAEGATVREMTVGHYTAPAVFRPGKPGKVHFVRHGLTATVSWGAVAGVRSYHVKVRGSDGRLETVFRKPSSRTVTLTNVLPFERFSATVVAVGGHDMLAGRPATATLAPVKPRTKPKPKPKHRR